MYRSQCFPFKIANLWRVMSNSKGKKCNVQVSIKFQKQPHEEITSILFSCKTAFQPFL